jgi:predicted dehydrogenase
MWQQRGDDIEEILLDTTDQYTVQGDLFSEAVLQDSEVPTPIEDSVANMKIIEAIVHSAGTGTWL